LDYARGVHGGARRQPVIDQDDSAAPNVRRRTTAAVKALAPRQLLRFARRDGIDQGRGNAEALDELIIEHTHATRRNRAHRQFLIAGNAELADHKDVQRCTERAGYLIGDRYAATRQRQHEHVRAIGIGCELLSELPARFPTIAKQS
jgi:hypothetical protein